MLTDIRYINKSAYDAITDPAKVNIVSVSGGKDSTALLTYAVNLGVPFQAVFADTGHEHVETIAYLDYLEKRFDLKIIRVTADFSDLIANKRRIVEQEWEDEDRKKEALEVLVPTGIPMLDLALAKGRFPSTRFKFCTRELKVLPIIEQVYEPIWDSGKEIVVWQGIRRSESKARANAAYFESTPEGWEVFRPLIDWTARDVFDYHKANDVEPNPLYKLGMGRVGCMPCVNTGKEELYEIARRFPDVIDRVEKWEQLVSSSAKQGKATFFTIDGLQGDGIRDRVSWSYTSYGGRQIDLFRLMDDVPVCSSQYGLCE